MLKVKFNDYGNVHTTTTPDKVCEQRLMNTTEKQYDEKDEDILEELALAKNLHSKRTLGDISQY